MVNTGLEGIVAATTHLSHVDGERGELIIAGFPVGELAARATFGDSVVALERRFTVAASARRVPITPRRPTRSAACNADACSFIEFQ
jgi:citrate synthase